MKHHPSELGLTTAAPPSMVIRTLAPGDADEAVRWDAFVAGCRGATFFHRSGWRQVIEEIEALTAYRQCKVDYFPFIDDFTARKGEEAVDREALLEVLTDFLKANNLKVDWEGVERAPNEALVNALAMMSPYGPAEKQAMLEAPDLKTRTEILIAVTEMDLAKKRTSGDPPLQ